MILHRRMLVWKRGKCGFSSLLYLTYCLAEFLGLVVRRPADPTMFSHHDTPPRTPLFSVARRNLCLTAITPLTLPSASGCAQSFLARCSFSSAPTAPIRLHR